MRKKWFLFKYVCFFLLFFLLMSFFFSLIDQDVLWNYGFSYAISKGEIPYQDFNMIITPFYPMLMAIPLKLISTNIAVYYAMNCLLLVIMFYLLDKMFHYRSWIFLVFLIFPFPSVIFPTYNFFLVFLLVCLLYLEKENKNDYWIGVLLAISFLTKQTVGFFLCLPSIYYLWKDREKFRKRIISFSAICTLFLCYLLFTKSLSSFFDLCLFGLFDFTKKNGKVFNVFFYFSIFLIMIVWKKMLKEKEDIRTYYVLAFSSILLPLFDINHFCYFLFAVMLLLVENIRFSKKEVIGNCCLFFVLYVWLFFGLILNPKKIMYPNHYSNFEFRLLYNDHGEFMIRNHLNQYLQKNKKKKIFLLSSEAYFYRITNHQKITHFDLLNYGNHGIHGTHKMIEKIQKSRKDTLWVVSYDEYQKEDRMDRQQINKEIIKYVVENAELVEEFDCFKVYKFS